MMQVLRRDKRQAVLRQRPRRAVDRVVLVQVVAHHKMHLARFLDLDLVPEIVQDVGWMLADLVNLWIACAAY